MIALKRLTNRDEQILLLLKKFDFLTRDQLREYFKLGTVRNTNYAMRRLSNYLMVIRESNQSIYYLSKLGREYVDCEKVRKRGGHVQHIVMRNQYWLHCGSPKDWQNEVKILIDNKPFIIADAKFTRNGFVHFLEVDHTQTMKENRAKIERYKKLTESLVKQFGYYPTIVWVTSTEHRRKQLDTLCKGLKSMVYTSNDIK